MKNAYNKHHNKNYACNFNVVFNKSDITFLKITTVCQYSKLFTSMNLLTVWLRGVFITF